MHPTEFDGLVAFWDFQEDGLLSRGPSPARLEEVPGPLERVSDGFFGPKSLRFTADGHLASAYLKATQTDAPTLGVGGPDAQVTVVAWLKREASDYGGCQFVAGIWNEHHLRQYGMFLNLHIWDGSEQACAHVSSHGGPTPGYPYCMDAAIGGTRVSFDEWHCIAMTYDGESARIFLDGQLDPRGENGAPGANPFHYPGGLLKGSADFTVGAVARPATVKPDGKGGFVEEGALIANPFVGLLGGLAIYSRAMTENEISNLASG